MITTLDSGRYFHVSGETSDEIQQDLDKAVQRAEGYAQREGWQGVLVSRHQPNLYTVAVSAEVPYGLTRERNAEISPGTSGSRSAV
ncbi:hypothetical protein AYX19_21225 (plasmid) [Paenarthrobacter ureafaciens]|nr:hypothetical protein AYX19_21225 [Paenarthrobacter ureafaciens]